MHTPRIVVAMALALVGCGSADSTRVDGGTDASVDSAPNTSDASIDAADAGSRGIYWGAIEDGNDTYDYYYGPPGFWLDAPFPIESSSSSQSAFHDTISQNSYYLKGGSFPIPPPLTTISEP